MTTAVQYRTREEWLCARRIGGSDVATALGVSPWASPWDLALRLRGEKRADRETPAMRRGRRLEARVLARYEAATGTPLRRSPPYTLVRREEWATASLDAIGLGDDGLIVEAKTAADASKWGPTGETIERWEASVAEVVPRPYWLQTAHYMWVCDRPRADVVVMFPRPPADAEDPFDPPEVRVYHLLRDREAEAAIVEHLRGWYRRHVVDGEDLPWDGSWAATGHLAGISREGARKATLDEVAMAAAYRYASGAENAWKAERKRVGQRLIASAAGAERLEIAGGGRVSVVRNGGRSELDEQRLRRDHPDLAPLLDQYRRPGDPYVYPKVTLGG